MTRKSYEAEEIKHLRELYDERFASIKKQLEMKDEALKIQATEYERRLDGLNHEAARILESQSKSISVDKHEGFSNQVHSKIDQATRTMEDKYSGLSKQVYIITGGIAVYEIIFKYLMK